MNCARKSFECVFDVQPVSFPVVRSSIPLRSLVRTKSSCRMKRRFSNFVLLFSRFFGFRNDADRISFQEGRGEQQLRRSRTSRMERTPSSSNPGRRRRRPHATLSLSTSTSSSSSPSILLRLVFSDSRLSRRLQGLPRTRTRVKATKQSELEEDLELVRRNGGRARAASRRNESRTRKDSGFVQDRAMVPQGQQQDRV